MFSLTTCDLCYEEALYLELPEVACQASGSLEEEALLAEAA